MVSAIVPAIRYMPANPKCRLPDVLLCPSERRLEERPQLAA
jgi:hypothetical protein